jgi:hypothetical protein
MVEVLYPYEPRQPHEVAVVAGQRLTVTRQDPSGWWEGSDGKVSGWFPANYVKIVETPKPAAGPPPPPPPPAPAKAAEGGGSLANMLSSAKLKKAPAEVKQAEEKAAAPPAAAAVAKAEEKPPAQAPAGDIASELLKVKLKKKSDTQPPEAKPAVDDIEAKRAAEAAEEQKRKDAEAKRAIALADAEAKRAAAAAEAEAKRAAAATEAEAKRAAAAAEAEAKRAAAVAEAEAKRGADAEAKGDADAEAKRVARAAAMKAAEERNAQKEAEAKRKDEEKAAEAKRMEEERRAADEKRREEEKRSADAKRSETKSPASAQPPSATPKSQKPAAEVAAVGVFAGGRVWVPDDAEGWVPAMVVSISANQKTVTVQNAAGQRVDVARELVGAAEIPPHPHALDDLTLLVDVHEAPVLLTLKERFKSDDIYTYIGQSVIIAVNPFRWLPSASAETLRSYIGVEQGETPPHIFAIADAALREMIADGVSQSLIVSGESGAGKTESCKLVMRFMGEACSRAQGGGRGDSDAALVERLMAQIIKSNPVLEAFGNAKTVRNNNSSRFGKFLMTNFNSDGSPCGASLACYLLEKSRVVAQNDPERNFHIFYQFVKGLDAATRAELSVGGVRDYFYLSQSGCSEIDGVDDKKEFEETVDSMEVIGINEAKRSELFRIISAILHIGNSDFEFAAEGEGCAVKRREAMERAAQLLGLDVAAVERALTFRKIITRGEVFEKALDAGQCRESRDSMAKAIYSRTFDWLFDQLNAVMKAGRDVAMFLGILDIYGFEIFEVRGGGT